MSEPCRQRTLRKLTYPALSSMGDFPLPAVAPVPPDDPAPSSLWWDSTNGRLYIFYSAQWVEVVLSQVGEMYPPSRPLRKTAKRMTLASALKQAAKAGRFAINAEVYADHVRLGFGAPEPEKTAALTPLEGWKAKRDARRA
ncbi:MAG TPA: hypothetical protein VGG77_13485 [Roseiarcus sp.]|jgi:hypothetical protein